MGAYVRKIRPGDPNYGKPMGIAFPWLVFTDRRAMDYVISFPTQYQALHLALTGTKLQLTPEQRVEIKNRPGRAEAMEELTARSKKERKKRHL